MSLREWPDVLRAAGIKVKVLPSVEWLTNGPLLDCNPVWHHDASPPGDSPGVPEFMIRNYKRAGAQVWINRGGVWHFISYGMAYHAGEVNDRRFSNPRSVGIETDLTVGETPTPALLESLRAGTAAVLRHEGKTADHLGFHKTICVPRGRKSDPWGLTLGDEAALIARRLGGTPTPLVQAVIPAAASSWEDILMHVYLRFSVGDAQYIANTLQGTFYQFPDPAARDMRINILTAAGHDVKDLGEFPADLNLEAHFGQRVSQFDADPRIELLAEQVAALAAKVGA